MPFSAGEHPRLYFSAADLPDLRTRARHGERAATLARYLDWCERILDPADPAYFDYHNFKRPEWQFRKSIFLIRPNLIMLSFAYALTGERKYGEAARDAVISLIHHKMADGTARVFGADYPGWRRGIGHDKAIYAWSMSTAYDLCFDLFSPDQRQLFAAHALESIEMVLNNLPVLLGDMGQMVNNRGARGLMGPFGCYTLALEGDVEIPDAVTNIQRAVAGTEAYLHVAFEEDGVCFEGPGYAQGLEPFYFFCLMLKRSGRLNLLRSKRWEQYLHHLVSEVLPGGYSLNNLNDTHIPCGTVMPSLFLMGDERVPILPWLAYQLDLHPRRIEYVQTHQDEALTGANSPSMLLHWQDDAPVLSPQELGYPTARRFSHRGIASMRTGWAANDMLISHRCGREMWRLHRQSDQNHLALYALGEHFLADEGYGQPELTGAHNPHKPVDRYFSMADVHNTIIFDGRDQNGNQITPGWAEGRLIDFRHTAHYDTSLGDACEAYGPDHAIDSAMRRVVFVHQTPQPFVIVIDTMRVDATQASHHYEALWRTAAGNTIESAERQFTITGTTNDCVGDVLYPRKVSLLVKTHHNREQVRVATDAMELAMVTALTPVARGQKPPQFSCERDANADFVIVAADGPVKHTITAGTRTSGVLHSAIPIKYERC